MLQSNIITINNQQYYKADDIYEINPKFFYGCANNIRNIVTRKNIPNNSYLYAYMKDNEWIISNKTYCRAKLLLYKSWAEKNIKGIIEDEKLFETLPPEIKLNEHEYFCDLDGNKMEIKICGNRKNREFYFNAKDISNKFEFPSLEKQLIDSRTDGYQVNTHYKYFYSKKNKVDGKGKTTYSKSLYLTHNGILKCIFSSVMTHTKINQNAIVMWVNNIVYNLNIDNRIKLQKYDNVTNTRGYVYIIDPCSTHIFVKIGFWRSNINGLYSRYATYYGKDIEIICYESKNAPQTEKNLFDTFKKYNISGELYDKKYKNNYISYLDVNCKRYVSKNINKFVQTPLVQNQLINCGDINEENNDDERIYKLIPCVYLFTLGTAKDLRNTMKLDAKYSDNMIICKYGKTDNLERRANEHIALYGQIEGCNLMLKYYSYIDPIYITEAENYIKDYMNILNAHIIYEHHKELVALDPKMLNDKISVQYNMVAKKYSGCIAELQNKIKNLENELLLEKQKHIISDKDKQIEDLKNKHEIELLKKEIEYMRKNI